MAPKIEKSAARPRRPLVAGGLVVLVAALAVAGWQLAQRRALAVASIPTAPTLPANRSDLLDELNARDQAARSFLHPAAGLARLSRLYHANGY